MALLKNGNKQASGGKRENAGRKPDWLKEKCQKIVDRIKVLEFLGDVVEGKDVEQIVNDVGETLRVPPPIRERIKASEILLERAYGKVKQELEHSGEVGGGRLIFVFPEDHKK